MSRIALAFAASAVLAACGYSGPPCEDLDFGEVTVDTSSGEPVVSWTGDQPNDLAFYAGDHTADLDRLPYDELEWALTCECKANVEHPDKNIGCKDRVDWDYRACISSPVSWADPGTAENVREEKSAKELVSGETYTAILSSYCDAGRVESAVTFVMP